MTSLFVVAHHTRGEIGPLLVDLERWCQQGGHHLWMLPADARARGVEHLGHERSAMDADIVLSLGGDGTVLRAVHLLDGAPVPILGVNVGTLGYLTEIEPSECVVSLQKWVDGTRDKDFIIDQRMMLSVLLKRADGSSDISWRALNEAVLEKQQSGHTVWLDVSINAELFARYSADGLIVSTPTGSTAYSMSARGPVVSPRHRALLVTPVSPHMLFDRALVLDPQESLVVEVVGTRPVDMALDGRKVTSLTQGDVVSFGPDTCVAHFLRFATPKFHQIVRTKFGLGDD
ncbi:MAG: NAD(+)/NADH kinase [Actinobacteria bacterium]|nr:MAG: NAD(+)/NADH kinase [Actinomycetota bacterium]